MRSALFSRARRSSVPRRTLVFRVLPWPIARAAYAVEKMMSALRVLHLVPSFVGGGAERQLVYLANAQAAMGIDTHIGYVQGGPNLDLVRGGAVGLHRVAGYGNHDPLLMLRIANLIRSVQPSIVQTWILQMDVFGGLAARFMSVPWVLSERASAEHYRGWKNALRRRVAAAATAIVANSETGLEYWRELPASTKRRTIRNIVPLQAIAGAAPVRPSDLGISQDTGQIILAAGRLEPQKNWFVLLDALDLALRKRPAAQAVLFGEGYLRADIARRIASLTSASRIHLRGYSDNLWGWLKRASVYVSLSNFEGTPNVLLEALACGCPVVLSDIPTHREVVSVMEAELVPTTSPAAAAHAIDRVLSAPPPAATNLALSRLQRWSAHNIAGQYAALYREILDGNVQSQPAENRSRT
jgi:glycosyltransferase involved in cell wall biosynthesis